MTTTHYLIMPSAVTPERQPTAPDDLDALFNYDAGLEEAANPGGTDNNGTLDTFIRQGETAQVSNLDEEVVVTKRRLPIAKLDETRILSTTGIPRLQKISKKMRYKGKGHEFSDMSRLLHMYQLWLDDLYPRAKFADGLNMIEKLGHKKRIQMHRKEWIDEGKPRPIHIEVESRIEDEHAASANAAPMALVATDPLPHSNAVIPESALASISGLQMPTTALDQETNQDSTLQREPEEDELDALMAEAQQPDISPPKERDTNFFADEEEAMADMGW
ncbi:Swi3-domain-containing protein [Myriangium duriaei CBS 260.36]|uniref:Chromosome segregation in meiosis protein n=1 Tax=Myriangium duriaei CBS 260.36 TaxID=1168546 RepID=A0A9P4J1K8_9PEZI|nr:Swi3-domain-containing protein [Myriangium duriaei CBS 260.36]